MRTARRLGARLALALAACALAAPAAQAASVAYIEAGNIWLASPDGRSKVQLTTSGTPQEPWLGVAQAPNGITVGVYDGDPFGPSPRLHRLKVWNAKGIPVRDLPLPAGAAPSEPDRPRSLEISDDGLWVANEYVGCLSGTTDGVADACASLARGTWYARTDGARGGPADTPGFRQGTFLGNRLVFSDGQRILVQRAPGTPGTTAADPWAGPPAGLAYRRADVPPPGGKVAIEVFNAAAASQNQIAVLPYAGEAGTGAADASQGCTMGAPFVTGNAFAAAWSPDGAQIAWRDAQGLKVAGAPVLPWPSQEPCSLTAPPVLISSLPAKSSADLKDSGYMSTVGPSFGGADVPAIIAARAAAKTAAAPDPSAPAIAPLRITSARALARGLRITVTSWAALPIAANARIGSALAARLRIPTIIAAGKAKADHAGQKVTITLRLTARARRSLARLRGATVTVRATQGGRTSSRALRLRRA